MGVAPYKTFTFGGTSSATYGAYITGEGVFNAPERAVEMIDIPGRNGAFALDYGRFNNIEVTYHVGMHDVTDANFAQKVSDFRNFLCSKVGYTRLEDEYNANEYRMAIYKSGLEVEHEGLLNGEFDIVFECKPQRFLTSGETATAVANNGTLSNPTLFDASPLLEVTGYGVLMLGSDEISIDNAMIGDIVVYNQNQASTQNVSFTVETQYANAGDDIKFDLLIKTNARIDAGSIALDSPITTSANATGYMQNSGDGITICVQTNTLTFDYGTSATEAITSTFSFETTNYGTLTGGALDWTLSYDGVDTFTIARTTTSFPAHITESLGTLKNSDVVLSSTQYSVGSPLYIDLDIGEAYKIENDVPVSVNNAVTIPAELPKLVPGTNTFTYDNTITQFKVVPRWWKV